MFNGDSTICIQKHAQDQTAHSLKSGALFLGKSYVFLLFLGTLTKIHDRSHLKKAMFCFRSRFQEFVVARTWRGATYKLADKETTALGQNDGHVCQGDPISQSFETLQNYLDTRYSLWGNTLYPSEKPVRTGRSNLLRGILLCAATRCLALCGRDGTLATRQYLLLDRHNQIANQQGPLEKMQGIVWREEIR